MDDYQRLTSEAAASEIERLEQALTGRESAAWFPLAHARKEYGHILGGGDSAYHLRIVARDLHHARVLLGDTSAPGAEGEAMKLSKVLIELIESRVSAIEKSNGWNRDLGWSQVDGEGQETLYEFGRFAMLVDLLEEFA